MPKFVDLAVPGALDRVFTYALPAHLRERAATGVRAVAPFGRKTVVGIIMAVSDTSTVPGIRELHDIIDDTPVLGGELIGLGNWISEYYHAPIGEVLRAMLVRGSTGMGKTVVRAEREITDEDLAAFGSAPVQKSILSYLRKSGPCSVASLQKALGSKGLHTPIHDLRRKGYVSTTEERPAGAGKPKTETFIRIDAASRREWRRHLRAMDHDRRPGKQRAVLAWLADATVPDITPARLGRLVGASPSVVASLVRKGVIATGKREVARDGFLGEHVEPAEAGEIRLNAHQQAAVDTISAALGQRTFSPFLLRGVTGSGKTQVYIESIRRVLDDGGTALVMVPEISLTPQTVGRFRRHFGDRVITFHSRMSQGERFDAWRFAREGRYSIVIGPRSAVFAPLPNLRLIVVDEEHEPSYKQFDQSPRYNARDAAMVRASIAGAVVVLGSATPSCESYFNAISGRYRLLELPDRADGAKLPDVRIVDMVAERNARFEAYRATRKDEFRKDPLAARLSGKKFSSGPISDLLLEKMRDRLGRKEGILLLQNRRGFSAFVECAGCGRVEMCDHCQISLTYHRPQRHLRCHYCGAVKQPPLFCPDCGAPDYHQRGFGTQRVEEEIRALIPGAALERMDLDTTTRKGSHARILNRFASGEIDILLGTQMIAKGLDIPRITLVGVISADTQLLLPDFRASERTFQLLTQVAGRSGRRRTPGEVVIQTMQPGHPTMRDVRTHDFTAFYNDEIVFRKELGYPPYTRITLLEFSGRDEGKVRRAAETVSQRLGKPGPGITLLGPAPAAFPKIRDRYRWHIVLKVAREKDPSGSLLRGRLEDLRRRMTGDVRLVIDTDPQSLM